MPKPILSAPWRAPVPLPHVEKLADERGARNKRIRVNGCLNRYCVATHLFESKLRARTPKIVFQQHRPNSDMEPVWAGNWTKVQLHLAPVRFQSLLAVSNRDGEEGAVKSPSV